MSTPSLPVQVYIDEDFYVHFEDGDNRRLAEDAWLRDARVAVGLILTDHQVPEFGLLMRTLCHDDVYSSWEEPEAIAGGGWISWYVDQSEPFGVTHCRAPGLHVIDLRAKNFLERA